MLDLHPRHREEWLHMAPIEDLSDEELDRYILTRLAMVGVDLDVLPKDDPEAPVDRRRILEGARSFLRGTEPEIRNFPIPEGIPPFLYPSRVPDKERGEGDGP